MPNRTGAVPWRGAIRSRRGQIDHAVAPTARRARCVLVVSQALVLGTFLPAGFPARGAPVAPSWEHWYERGLTNHHPAYEKRLRVNPPGIEIIYPSPALMLRHRVKP
jgi:hypothetical protein